MKRNYFSSMKKTTILVSSLHVQFGAFTHSRTRGQLLTVHYSVPGVEQRDRITHYAGDRYRTTVKYGDCGLKFRDFPKLTAKRR